MRTRTEIKPRRGRPPAFDRDRALAAIDGSFLTSGFNGLSIDDLAAATGLHRPSLRAAFGDRQDMFVGALDRLRQGLSAQLQDLFSTDTPIKDHLRAFYAAALGVYLDGEHGPTGCLAICTATVEAYGDPVIRKRLAGIIRMIDEALAARFARAVRSGELPPQTDPQGYARLAGALLHSVAVRARAGEPRDVLESMVAQGVALLTRPPDPTAPRIARRPSARNGSPPQKPRSD